MMGGWAPPTSRLLLLPVVAAVLALGNVEGGAVEDRQGLRALFNATGGGEGAWEDMSGGWGVEGNEDHCSWFGVSCNDRSRVVSLSLTKNGLQGELVDAGPDFWGLSELEMLDLSHNSLHGSLPDELSNLAALTQLNLGFNAFSGRLPGAWLAVESDAAYPLVHTSDPQNATAGIFPSLRALYLEGNEISQDAYTALQTVLGWPSVSVLDLSSNRLLGDLDGALRVYYCADGPASCLDIRQSKTRLSVLLLRENEISGEVPESSSLPPVLSFLDISGNSMWGAVPDSYEQLSFLLLGGNDGLNSTSLPSFTSLSKNVTVAEAGSQLCPVIESLKSQMYIELGSGYLGYSHCYCGEGLVRDTSGHCTPCPLGTFRGAEELARLNECAACPVGSTTVAVGSTSVYECTCISGRYAQSGGNPAEGPINCTPCPQGSTYEGIGAKASSDCECDLGLYMKEGACVPCDAGTFKSVTGNSEELCVSCPAGQYSASAGATTSLACSLCPDGTYSSTVGASSADVCSSCPPGTYGVAQGLFSEELCLACPAGTWASSEGSYSLTSCNACPKNTFSQAVGALSSNTCQLCPSGTSSQPGSFACAGGTGNTKQTLLTYLIVGSCTLAVILFVAVAWHKGKAASMQKIDSRTDVPLRMARAKRTAHNWAVFFHTLETIDLMTAIALFSFLMSRKDMSGLILVLYCITIAVGLTLTLQRLYKVWWAKFRLHSIFITEGEPLHVHATQNRKRTRLLVTHKQARLVPELVRMLRHLQVNKFKVQLAVVIDLPLTILNLWVLWSVDTTLITNPIFLISLILAVFNAGKISTLIEYHLELRQRMRKLAHLLSLELHKEKDRPSASKISKVPSPLLLEEGDDEYFESVSAVTSPTPLLSQRREDDATATNTTTSSSELANAAIARDRRISTSSSLVGAGFNHMGYGRLPNTPSKSNELPPPEKEASK